LGGEQDPEVVVASERDVFGHQRMVRARHAGGWTDPLASGGPHEGEGEGAIQEG